MREAEGSKTEEYYDLNGGFPSFYETNAAKGHDGIVLSISVRVDGELQSIYSPALIKQFAVRPQEALSLWK